MSSTGRSPSSWGRWTTIISTDCGLAVAPSNMRARPRLREIKARLIGPFLPECLENSQVHHGRNVLAGREIVTSRDDCDLTAQFGRDCDLTPFHRLRQIPGSACLHLFDYVPSIPILLGRRAFSTRAHVVRTLSRREGVAETGKRVIVLYRIHRSYLLRQLCSRQSEPNLPTMRNFGSPPTSATDQARSPSALNP